MSKASTFNVAWVEHRIPVLVSGHVTASDVIASVLHWAEANREHEEADDAYRRIIDHALEHFEAERGVGDDLANDPYYDELLIKLETTS